ncbi:MAG: efflux RND transporter periplasmic adaptor subunit [Bacillota bacterium]|nr:efflux RND transporter periplasmic adaptor subunit [Bacillota bacterium]
MKKKVLIGSVILILVIAFSTISIMKNKGTSTAFSSGKTHSVKVSKIRKGDISASISASGIIEQVDDKEVNLETPFKVLKVFFKNGDSLKKGDKIFDIDLSEIRSQIKEMELNRDVQQLSIQKLKIASVEKSSSSLEDAVKLAKKSVDSSILNFDEVKKKYDDAQAGYERLEVSKSEVEDAQKALDSAQSAVDTAQINYNSAINNLNELKKGNTDSNASLKIDIETQEKNMEITNMKLDEIKEKLKKYEDICLSPSDGVINEISIKEGGFTSNMQPLFKIFKPEGLEICANIKEYDIRNVKQGQRVAITGDSIDKEKKVTGKVLSISPVAKKSDIGNNRATVIEAKISIENSEAELKAGMNVTCEVFTNEKKDILLVDFEMIKEDKDGNKFVYVVDKNNIMHYKEIKLGINSDMKAEVLSGLSLDDSVIIGPLPTFADGDRVKIMESTDGEGS